MAEYIEKAAAVKIAVRYGLACGSVLGRHSGLADCIAEEISQLPATDVAPVVRCKGCVHYRKYMGRDKCAKNATVLDGREVGFHATGKDEFCSYGKYQTNTGGKQ